MKKDKLEFCHSDFKPAIGLLTVLIVLVIGWSTWELRHRRHDFTRAFLTLSAAQKPPAGNIRVNDKMLHPYWGNCNQCHITIDAPTTAVSKVFKGPPISVKTPMTHDYWGNCTLCHLVTDGFQQAPQTRLVAAAPKPVPPIQANAKLPHADWGACTNCHKIIGAAPAGTPAAFNQLTASSLGLKVQAVTAAQMQQLGLISEDGIMILTVAPGSIADQAGLKAGDEMLRIDKIRLETMADFTTALAQARPNHNLKVNLFRGRQDKNVFLFIPENLPQNMNVAAANVPLTQNQIETRAEQLGVAKTAPAVQQALAAQNNLGGNPGQGLVAVAVSGSQLDSPLHPQFGANPYFVLYDPSHNTYRIVGNPNFNRTTGKEVQSAQYLADLGVSNIIAGNFSADGFSTLRTLRIAAYSGVTGTAGSTLAMYAGGQLRPIIYPPQVMIGQAGVQPAQPNTGGFF